MDPLSEAIAKQFPDTFGGATAGATTARDGQTLAAQNAPTQSMFNAVWGGDAPTQWVIEHNVMLQMGH